MSGVIAGSATMYIPKELSKQDMKMIGKNLERKVAGARTTNGEGTYKSPSDSSYRNKY